MPSPPSRRSMLPRRPLTVLAAGALALSAVGCSSNDGSLGSGAQGTEEAVEQLEESLDALPEASFDTIGVGWSDTDGEPG